jgi:hypothetical protein
MSFAVFKDSAQAMAAAAARARAVVDPPAVVTTTKENLSSQNLSMAAQELQRQQQQQRGHESAVSQAWTDPSSHLERWVGYLKWAQRQPPGAGVDTLVLLERCTRTFADQRSVRDQRKYLRVWINYADLCSDPENVFAYMWSHKIGIHHALFFEAKAAMHETAGDYARAAKTLSAGIKVGGTRIRPRVHCRVRCRLRSECRVPVLAACRCVGIATRTVWGGAVRAVGAAAGRIQAAHAAAHAEAAAPAAAAAAARARAGGSAGDGAGGGAGGGAGDGADDGANTGDGGGTFNTARQCP